MAQTASSHSGAESFAQFLTVFLVFLLVLALTYFTTRFVGSFQKVSAYNRNFEAIETYRITNGKYLQLVRVGEKYLIIGISKDNVNLICEISEDEIDFTKNKPRSKGLYGSEAFKSIMDQAKRHLDKGGNDNEK